ncbi:allophanate hydrolase [Achromobacter anxifer]|uniref:Allophanate hydrolase n=1 Tax=Achromobacter anxifer TaxID=1287737 RepID=A0A6S7EPD0_9BURK|nr:allophanate hydrolase [Achromobacter anxifer]MDF8361758.1 allophanate hydrolase [Achromobacter anxifer]CAB3917859.1 Allophanate hydrolase [Achromobacter anxifer]
MNAAATQKGPIGWTIAQWQAAYRDEGATPETLLAAWAERGGPPDNAWIKRVDGAGLASQLQALRGLLEQAGGDLARLPLYGVPFAIKDNIDAAGWPTTAACPEFAYTPDQDATVVGRLRAAGAILVGKTNLDQFATGLVGTRSPLGAVVNTFNPEYVSGGSSSGSASVVARGLAAFSLGTDTAGSGRVPAGFNNIVGLKPTKGRLSAAGVVPACRTQDCVSVFALTVDDAELVADIAAGFDERDPYSRAQPAGSGHPWPAQPRLAVPAQLEFFGDAQAAAAFDEALWVLKASGAVVETIDFTPFNELAALLYQGPWVAERFAAVEALWKQHPDAIHPVVRGIVEQAAGYSALDAFKAEYRRAELARRIHQSLQGFDALFVPTAPSIYTIAQLEADPVTLNSRLGVYTNFANLADLSALALPAGMRGDGLPAGITVIGLAWQDHALAQFGRQWQARLDLPLGATGAPLPAASQSRAPARDTVRVSVVGAHLRGMPLNHQLTSRRAVFVEQARTAGDYRLYALANTTPPKPGLVKSADGAPIEVELWDVPLAAFGAFVAEIPAPLGIGTLELEDGRLVKGFICEPRGLEGARDITAFGGWRAYLASLAAQA